MGLVSVAPDAGRAIVFWSEAKPVAGSGAAPGEVCSVWKEADAVGDTSGGAGACAGAAATAASVVDCCVAPLSERPAGAAAIDAADDLDEAPPNPNRAPTAVTPALSRAMKLGDAARAGASVAMASASASMSAGSGLAADPAGEAVAAAGDIRRTATEGESTLFNPALAAATASTSAADAEKAAAAEDETPRLGDVAV